MVNIVGRFPIASILSIFLSIICIYILKIDLPSKTVSDAFLARLDQNNDGCIQLYDLVKTLLRVWTDCPIQDGVVELKTTFISLNLESTGINEVQSSLLETNLESISGLLNWKYPNKENLRLHESRFSQLVPEDEKLTSGYLWQLYEPQEGFITNEMHYEHVQCGIETLFRDLLVAFHPQPYTQVRFQQRGGYGIVRAINESIIDILFRFHAEFQLNTPPLMPFWFTPSMFIGQAIFDRHEKRIIKFNLRVPNERKVNVDMEWYNKDDLDENLQVDIGHMPKMELEMKRNADDLDINYEMMESISRKEALLKLEYKFFKFKQIPYYEFQEAIDQARMHNKLLHSIVMWGALDDHSC